MTVEEALTFIKNTNVCYSCKYRGSGCERQQDHIWSDGYCQTYNAAVAIIEEKLQPIDTPEPQTEPEQEP